MAGSLNRVEIIGNVGGDPEIKALQNGNKVANFSIATSESWTDKNTGEKKEHTDWHRIVVWNEGLVGVIEKYVHKGDKIYIEGKLKTRKWQDQNGTDRYATEVVLTGYDGKLILLGGKRNGGEGGSAGGSTQTTTQPATGGQRAAAGMDDEIPF